MNEYYHASTDHQSVGEPSPRALPKWLLPLVTGVAGLVVGAALVGGAWLSTSLASQAAQQKARTVAAKSAADAKAAQSKILSNAIDRCDLDANPDAQLGDNGYSLTIDGQGDEDAHGLSIDDEACVLTELRAPSATLSHIDQTTAMDGRQSETWGQVTFSWSYHPDRGLDGVFSVARDK